jgi:hypothetical protein
MHPLIQKILDEGVDAISVDMLSDNLKKTLLTEAGKRLLNHNRPEEAAKAFAKGNSVQELKEQGIEFMKQRKFGVAAHFLKHVLPHNEVEDLALQCLEQKDYTAAKSVYETLENKQMCEFIEKNFLKINS